jgi:hypothetical protein
MFSPIHQNLLLGEHAKAVRLMRDAVGFPQGRTIIRNALRLDPRMAPFRNDPEITALLAEPEPVLRRAGVSDRDLPLRIGGPDSGLPVVNGQNTGAAAAEDSPKK